MRARLGQGRASKRLAAMIATAARKHFETEDVRDVEVHPVPPVWRRPCFDVMLVEGRMFVDGRLRLFGSWESVTTLIQYRDVKFDCSDFCMIDINPDYETKRTKK